MSLEVKKIVSSFFNGTTNDTITSSIWGQLSRGEYFLMTFGPMTFSKPNKEATSFIFAWKSDCGNLYVHSDFANCTTTFSTDTADKPTANRVIELFKQVVSAGDKNYYISAKCGRLHSQGERTTAGAMVYVDLDSDNDHDVRPNNKKRVLLGNYFATLMNNSFDFVLKNPTPEPQKEEPMSQNNTEDTPVPSSTSALIDSVKAAATDVGKLQAGKALNVAIMKTLKKNTPMMVRGYLDHPFAPAIVSFGLLALSEYMPQNAASKKLNAAAQLMITDALNSGASALLDFESIFDTIFADLPPAVKAELFTATKTTGTSEPGV